jgi:hypothetical protein
MPIVFKLVGMSSEGKSYEIKDAYVGNITLKMLYDLFKSQGVTNEELDNIKFIIDTKQMQNFDQEYTIKQDESRTIFVFTNNEDIRKKLLMFFSKVGSEVGNHQPQVKNCELLKPLTDIAPEVPILTDEMINTMNQRTVKLFNDPDFIFLIKIIKTKPELLGTALQFVQHGTIVHEALHNVKTINDLEHDELEKYKTIALYFNQFELQFSEEDILKRLIKFNGIINLTLRSLLCDSV